MIKNFEYQKQQALERQILKSIKILSKGFDVLVKLQLEIMGERSKLRNKIKVYKNVHTESETDDLIYAMIRDKALPQDEILFVFDMTKEGLDEVLLRVSIKNKIN
jgi:hypothetical protein